LVGSMGLDAVRVLVGGLGCRRRQRSVNGMGGLLILVLVLALMKMLGMGVMGRGGMLRRRRRQRRGRVGGRRGLWRSRGCERLGVGGLGRLML
jgi:hypothetical protein